MDVYTIFYHLIHVFNYTFRVLVEWHALCRLEVICEEIDHHEASRKFRFVSISEADGFRFGDHG